MSEEQPNSSAEEVVQTAAEVKPEQPKDEYVPKSAYEEVSRDMHKNKNRYKEERARANELEAKLKAINEAKLAEEGRYKELAEKLQKEKEEAELNAAEKERKVRDIARKSALRQELGNIRDEYLSLADLKGIDFDEDGTISSESVRSVANKFRQDHSVLLPSNSAAKMTSQAPASSGVVTQTGEKLLSELSTEEKMNLIAEKRRSGS